MIKCLELKLGNHYRIYDRGGGGEEEGGGGEGGGTEQGLLCGVVTFLRGPNNQLMLELGEDHKEGKRVWLMATAPVPQY